MLVASNPLDSSLQNDGGDAGWCQENHVDVLCGGLELGEVEELSVCDIEVIGDQVRVVGKKVLL